MVTTTAAEQFLVATRISGIVDITTLSIQRSSFIIIAFMASFVFIDVRIVTI